MSTLRRLFQASAVTLTFASVVTYKQIYSNKIEASWTTSYEPSVKWDYNWDRREPEYLVKPKTKPPRHNKTNDESKSMPPEIVNSEADQDELNKKVSKATRCIILVRHGQYQINAKESQDRILTQLGIEQAEFTGQRLSGLSHKLTHFYCSTMIRAIQTADIINSHLPEKMKMVMDDILVEGAPIPPEPPVGHWKPLQYFFEDGSRIEAAFRKYFHRASPEQTENSYELIVCHGNVIRYFLCRALQLPPEAWLRFDVAHASISVVYIKPDGRVACRAIGESGHMPLNKITS